MSNYDIISARGNAEIGKKPCAYVFAGEHNKAVNALERCAKVLHNSNLYDSEYG